MSLYHIDAAACVVLVCWAVWKAAAPRYAKDSVFSKLIYSVIGVSATAVVLGPTYGYHQPPTPEVVLNCAMAVAAIRHFYIVFLKPNIRRWIRCRDCPMPPEE